MKSPSDANRNDGHGILRVAVHVVVVVVVAVVVVVVVRACLPPFIPTLIYQEEEYDGAECGIYVRARGGFVAIARRDRICKCQAERKRKSWRREKGSATLKNGSEKQWATML